jgi:phosphomevalonate kinase
VHYAQLESRGLPATREALASLPPFLASGTTLQAVHKTGLGSSAALITSLVAALLVRTRAAALDTPAGRRLVHHAAQHVHCLAQGKVGSGFDVAAAVFGSQRYTRFAPTVLAPLMRDVPVRTVELLCRVEGC